MKKTLLLILLLSSASYAVETDQFLAGSHVLKDSSDSINEYINNKFEAAILKVNEKKREYACRNLADDVLSEIVGRHSISALSKFAGTSAEIERYPDNSIKMHDYINDLSIYARAGFPFGLVAISRTINVGGVYVGTDKLGHFSLIGRNYYRAYLKNLDKGLSKKEAEKAAVVKGIGQEIHFLGYMLGGVLSYGDLEANFQGLQFAISMCESENPYLIKKNGDWIKNPERTFDIKNIINPKMDESYKPPFWSPRIWRRIAPNIKNVYCDLKENPLYIERMKFYESKISINKNDDYLKDFFKDRPKFDRNLENIDSLCK